MNSHLRLKIYVKGRFNVALQWNFKQPRNLFLFENDYAVVWTAVSLGYFDKDSVLLA